LKIKTEKREEEREGECIPGIFSNQAMWKKGPSAFTGVCVCSLVSMGEFSFISETEAALNAIGPPWRGENKGLKRGKLRDFELFEKEIRRKYKGAAVADLGYQ